MNKNEFLHKLTEYEIGLMKAKIGLLRADMTDTSGYDGQIAAIEYVKTLAMMLNESEKAGEPEEKPAEPAKNPENCWTSDCWSKVSVFNMCRLLSDKCDKEMDAMEDMDKCDKYNYDNINKLRIECRRFLTDWAIHNGAKND